MSRTVPSRTCSSSAWRPPPTVDAFAHPAPDDSGPVWLTWAQVGQRAKAVAAGLRGLGVGHEDPVAILANTRLDWVIADLGVMCAGGATTTVYPTTEPEDATFIIADSGSKVLIAENADPGGKIAGADLPALTHVVLIDGTADPAAAAAAAHPGRAGGRGAPRRSAAEPDLIEQWWPRSSPDHLATLIYTSGTTGRPKGVELLHAGWCWEGVAQAELGLLRADDLQYLWLPLSHSFGKTLLCGVIHVGLPTYVDGRIDKLVDLLAVVKPTLMCGAPRIFEKVYNRAVTTAQAAGGAKAKIFAWAVRGRQGEGRPGAGRPAGPGRPQAALRAGREAGLQQAPGPPRRPDAGAGLRRRAAEPGDRRLLRRRQPADLRGLRAHRDQRRQLRQPARRACGSARSGSRWATWSAGSTPTARSWSAVGR